MTLSLVALAANNLEQPHHVRGTEEVMSDNLLGTRRHRGNLVDVQRRCVGGQDGIRLGDLIEFREDIFFRLHVLEDGLDHDIGFFKAVKGQPQLKHREPLLNILGRKSPPLYRAFVVLSNCRQAAVQRFLRRFSENHGNPGVEIRHGDSAAHGPRADDAGLVYLENGRVFRNARDLAHFPLSKERMNQPLGLIGVKTLGKKLCFALDALIEGQLRRGFDCFDGFERGHHAASFLADRLANGGEDRSICRLIAKPVCSFTGSRRRPGLGPRFARKRYGARQQITLRLTLDNTVDNAIFDICGNRVAERAHLSRLGHAHQSRQPLGAGRPRDNTQLHLGLADLRRCNGDPIVASLGYLQPPSKRRSVKRGDHRLRTSFEHPQQWVKPIATLFPPRRNFSELLDVGPRDKRAASADQNKGVDRIVVLVSPDRFLDTLGNTRAESIYRRIINGDHTHRSVTGEEDEVAHAGRLLDRQNKGESVV